MRSRAAIIGFVALVAAGLVAGPPPAPAEERTIDRGPWQPPKGTLNTLADLSEAVQGCWRWPPIAEVESGMELTILLSFKRNGEIFGARITHESRHVSPDERALYYRALADALRRCSPLPISDSLGNAIAGRPFTFRFNDTRKQKKA